MNTTKTSYTLSKRNILRFLSVLLMVSIFLPIVSENVPILFSYLLNSALISLSILFLKPEIFLEKEMLAVYLFIAVFTILSFAGHYTINMSLFDSWFQQNILNIFTAILIYTYYTKTGDYKGLALVGGFAIFFIVLTAISTIAGNMLYPGASRYIYNGSKTSLNSFYVSRGIGGYGFVSGAALIMPAVIFQIKSTSNWRKLRWIFVLIIYYLSILAGSIVAPLIIASLGILFSFFITNISNWQFVLAIFLSLLVLLLPATFYANIFYQLANVSPNRVIQIRLEAIGGALEAGIDPYSSENIVENRASRYITNWELFRKSNPLIGTGVTVGEAFHLYFPSFVARFGIIGISSLLIIIISQFRYNFHILPNQYKKYYMIAVFLFLFLGLVKNIAGKEIYFYLFFVVPSIIHIGNFQFRQKSKYPESSEI